MRTPADLYKLGVAKLAALERMADKSATNLVAAIEASLDALALDGKAPLCLLGGLAPLYAPRLSDPYRAMLKEPLRDALGGAVAMAVRMFGRAEAARA